MPQSEATATHIHRLLDEHWTAALHVAPEVWRDADVVVAAHPEPSHADHVYVIRREDSAVFIVPQALVGLTAEAVGAWPSADVCDADFLRSLYKENVVSIHGPNWLAYATPETFRPIDARGTRPLEGDADHAQLEALTAAASGHEVLDAGLAITPRREYGMFDDDGTLICAGTLTPFQGSLANVGILTHPEHRREGMGTAMVSALTEAAFADGARAVQLRFSHDYPTSVRLASELGFVEDAVTFEVRLHDVDVSESVPVRDPR